jgi:tetratricopeptide (TPR) repeat protein
MKINTKVAAAVLGLVFIASGVKAQSLDDAKKAINAEQYQKAKSMLKNLTVTQADKDENYFYLGWVYLIQDEADSAKLMFNKGIAVNPKSSLNYVGLGAVARLDKDLAGMNTNFTTAISFVKKDSKPYVFIGRSYLLSPTGSAISPADANAAIATLRKDSLMNPKDPEIFIALGNAYLSQFRNAEAYNSFTSALELDPKSPAANVALGVISKYSNNYDDAEKQFQAALALDPNYGPAYREWAETDLRWGLNEPKMAAKKTEGVEHYKKYLSLTDMSVESQMRYADFLIYAHDPADYQILQQVATSLSKSAGTNLKIYRYLGYAAYENKDYANGLTAMNTWMTKAAPNRILPLDYVYLGHLQIASTQDSLGMLSLRKAYALDSTQVDVLEEIAKSLYTKEKYKQAGDAYALYILKNPKASLTDLFNEGRSYYFEFQNQYFSKATPKPTPDSTLLAKADTAFSTIQKKVTKPVADIALYRARLNDYKEVDRNNIKGLAKPFYEDFIKTVLAKGGTPDDRTKKNLAEAYDYLGRYYELVAKDDTQAAQNYASALANDPTDKGALEYNAKHKK